MLTFIEQFGRIDILIANAGCSYPVHFDNFNSQTIKKIMSTNYFGMVYAIEAILPHFIKNKSGHIVGMSSQASFITSSGSGAYSSSKAAINLTLESLRIELKPIGITVTTICPGYIKSPMTYVNKFYMPLLMPIDKGCKLIMKAIEKKKQVFIFPKRLHLMILLINFLPKKISHFLFSLPFMKYNKDNK